MIFNPKFQLLVQIWPFKRLLKEVPTNSSIKINSNSIMKLTLPTFRELVLLRAFIIWQVRVWVVICLISFLWMKGFELILHDTGQMIVDVIVRGAGLVIEQRWSGHNVGVLLEHWALLPAHVPHVDRLEVEVLGSVLGLQTAVVAAGRVGHGGAAAGRHLAPRHAAGWGLARPRVVGRVPVLQPTMTRGLNGILTQFTCVKKEN